MSDTEGSPQAGLAEPAAFEGPLVGFEERVPEEGLTVEAVLSRVDWAIARIEALEAQVVALERAAGIGRGEG